MPASHIYKVMFVNQGKIYEVYARKVSHGNLFGFIEIEELVFGERSTVVLDPTGNPVKAKLLSGQSGLLYRRNSLTGAVETSMRKGSWGGLNADLHKN